MYALIAYMYKDDMRALGSAFSAFQAYVENGWAAQAGADHFTGFKAYVDGMAKFLKALPNSQEFYETLMDMLDKFGKTFKPVGEKVYCEYKFGKCLEKSTSEFFSGIFNTGKDSCPSVYRVEQKS